MTQMQFKYEESKPFNGAISFLHRNFRSNYQKIVNVTASSQSATRLPSYAVDFSINYWYVKINAFIVVFFPYHAIKLDGYIVQSSNVRSNGCHPKSWYVSVSNDNNTFTDEEKYTDENEHMNHPNAFKYVPYSPTGIFNYFKLAIKEKSYCADGSDINQIELFGTLYTNKYQICSIKTRRHTLKHIEIMIFVLIC